MAGFAAAPASATAPCGNNGTFSSSGGVASCKYLQAGSDTFTVPRYRTRMTFDVWGAGGTSCAADGGEAKGDLAVSSLDQFQINIGGPPTNGGPNGGTCYVGGWNGGGHGGEDGFLTVYAGYGGAGASDVRTGGHGLSDRLFVGGGGGGNYVNPLRHSTDADGGGGGGTAGVDGHGAGSSGGTGGTQTAGGASGWDATSAGFGFGGSGGTGFGEITAGGSGGGGGWYGGGGSGSATATSGAGGGGGGSGHVTPAATNAILKTGGIHLANGVDPYEEVRAPDNVDVNVGGNIIRPPTYGNGEVIVSWDDTPVTAAVTVTSNRTNPVDPSALIGLTAHVATSTGAVPDGLVILVSNGKYNLGSGYIDGDGNFTLWNIASNLPVANNNVTATFYDWFGVIPNTTSPGLNVERDRFDQTIDFTSTAPSPATAGGATYSVSATASSKLPVTYLIPSVSSSVCSISGTTVTFLTQGTCVIEADQGGDGIYKPAPSEQQTVDVVWGSTPIPITATVFGVQSQGGTPHFFYNYTHPPGVTVSGTLSCTTVVPGTPIDTFLSLGSYTIDGSTCTGLDADSEHYSVVYAGRTNGFAVTRPAITITPSGSQTYLGSPTFTYTSNAPDGVEITGTLTCDTVGVGTLLSPTLLPFTYALSGCEGLNAPDGYTLTYAIGEFVVHPAVITVTVSGDQGYGGPPEFSWTDDYAPSVYAPGVHCTGLTDDTPIATSLDVGVYTIDGSTCSGYVPPPGYTVHYEGAQFLVNPGQVVVTISGSQTYGDASPTFGETDNAGTRVDLIGTPTCTRVAYHTAIVPTLSLGPHTIEPSSCSGLSLSDPKNFRLTYQQGSFFVIPLGRPISVHVSGTQAFGGTPHFSETDEAPSGVTLSGSLTCDSVDLGTAINRALPVGNHTVDGSTCRGLSAPGYEIEYNGVAYDFVVSAATINVHVSGTQAYGGSPQFTETDDAPAEATLSGTLSCDTVDGGTAIDATLAGGDHTVDGLSCDGLSAPGYTIVYDGVADDFVVSRASTSLLYGNPQLVVIPNSIAPSATLSSPVAACASGKTVSFSLDTNPLTGASGSYSLGSATTNSSGLATRTPAISTSGWHEGQYTITASFAGTNSCVGSTYEASLAVASTGDAASGGGAYNLAGAGRSNFGFNVRKVSNTSNTYSGQFLLINNGRWRLKGAITGYGLTGTSALTGTKAGSAGGSGALYWWNQALNGGLGAWQLAKSPVSFTISFSASGSGKKASPGSFGIQISYKPVAPQPASLPNSAAQLLKGGSVNVS